MAAKRYAIVGTGGRGLGMFARPLLSDFLDTAELVGLCDHNPLRLAAANQMLGTALPTFTDFQALLADLNPDGVIVCTKDQTHAAYIVEALEAGKRVYCEKPLCTTAAQCREILAAADCSPGEVFVTHNMRYGPAEQKIKQLLEKGKIGRLLSLEFNEHLDRNHGADYFRRWHRQKENSGGLLIHKASHHFDAMNWLAGSQPEVLTAMGDLLFYGNNGDFRGDRCLDCRHALDCDYYIDLGEDERGRLLYLGAEAEDGYHRDGCVFDPQIDIEDQASVSYAYANGVRVNYSLLAYAAYEGMSLVLEGTEGRLEYRSVTNTGWAVGNRIVPGMDEMAGESLKYFHPRKGEEVLEVARLEGSHGGSDPALRADFFARSWDSEERGHMATLEEAVQAVMVGAAANVSIAEGGRPVRVQELLAGDRSPCF